MMGYQSSAVAYLSLLLSLSLCHFSACLVVTFDMCSSSHAHVFLGTVDKLDKFVKTTAIYHVFLP